MIYKKVVLDSSKYLESLILDFHVRTSSLCFKLFVFPILSFSSTVYPMLHTKSGNFSGVHAAYTLSFNAQAHNTTIQKLLNRCFVLQNFRIAKKSGNIFLAY